MERVRLEGGPLAGRLIDLACAASGTLTFSLYGQTGRYVKIEGLYGRVSNKLKWEHKIEKAV